MSESIPINGWTSDDNRRRCHLIDKSLDGTITADESFELGFLQEAMLEYRRRVAPLPIEEARELLHSMTR